MKKTTLTITLLLAVAGILSLSSQSMAHEGYLVECKTKNLQITFTTFGEGYQSESHVKATYFKKELNTEDFKLKGKYQYSTYIQNYLFTLNGYPSYRGVPVDFSLSIKLFGDEGHILESGSCRAI